MNISSSAGARLAADQDPSLALERARRAIEGKFLEAGQTLEDAVEVIGGLIASLDRLTLAFDPQTVDATTQDLSEAANRLTGLSATHRQRRAGFETLSAAGGSLDRNILEMRRSLSYLRVFAVNIKITAGGIAAAGAEFGSFAEEIYASIDRGRVQLDEFAEDLARLDAHAAASLGQEVELEKRCAAALPAVPNQLQADAVAVAGHHKQVAAAAQRVGALARSIQMKVAGVLGALQVGDSTRQRIEHVQSALAMLGAAPMEGAVREAVGSAMRRLLAAQLDDTAAVFCAEIDKISQNLAGMAEDARDILELRRLAEGGSANDGFLPRLERSVGEALALVGEIEAADRGAAQVGAAAQATAAQLADRVATIRAIKSEIQQMALNANLKCGRMGEAGKPLSVIAVEMRTYASRLDETAEDTEAALGGLAQAQSAGPAAAVIAEADIGAVLQGAIARIGQASEAAGADLAGLAAQGETIAATLSRLSGRLNLRAEVGEVMARTGEALALKAGPPEAYDAAVAAVLDPLMERVGGLYTMAREREIHKAFATACAPPALAVA
jgi:hypothetical protein